MMGLAAYMPVPPRDRFDPMRALSIEKVTRPGNKEGLPIQLDDGFALLRETRSWVDSSFVRSCRRSAEGTECADLLAEPSTTVPATDFLFSEWMLPRPHVFQPVIADAASFELRLAPEAGGTREFELYDDTPGCGWQFDRAEGLETSTLPSRTIQVRSIAGAPARLTMTRQRSTGCAPPDEPFPACYREISVESTRPLARTAP